MHEQQRKSRGRPKDFQAGSETISLRVPRGMGTLIHSTLSHLNIASMNGVEPPVLPLLDSLRARLQQQSNYPGTTARLIRIEQVIDSLRTEVTEARAADRAKAIAALKAMDEIA